MLPPMWRLRPSIGKGSVRAANILLATTAAASPSAMSRQADHEFVAAKSCGGVAFPQAGAQAHGHGFEQLVADMMAERVVDMLEVVEIEHHHRHLILVAARLRDIVAQAILEQDPVRQARQRIVQRHVPDPYFGFLAIGDVADVALDDVGTLRPIMIADHFHVDRRAVAGLQDPMVALDAVMGLQLGQGRPAGRHIPEGFELPQFLSDQAGAVMTQHLDDRRVGVRDLPGFEIE